MSRVDSGDEAPSGRIAIIGMSGRFPGAPDTESLWRNVRDAVESITRLDDARLAAAGVDEATRRQPGYVPARGLLQGVELFDASFFDISPGEAKLIDPQQRLFLECAWEALESAGCDPEHFDGPIGLFAGAGTPGYLLHHLASQLDTRELLDGLGVLLGNDKDHLTTRVAYKLDLRGPAITVQTACSTSLVAVHLACQALLDFQCDMALAGGVSIAFPEGTGYLTQPGHILSPDGHCRAFDARAQGTVPGDGLGVVVLKRLEDALAAGDPIRAVILGTAVNNDGAQKVGYTAPSIEGQAEVIGMALALAGGDARSISYVEAHGTGTPMGDAIEVAALKQAFGRSTHDKGFCALGSLKTNVGHLNTAAGVAGLIKATLALENRLLPPSLHFTRAHPESGLADSPFRVNAVARPWDGPLPLRAGVSSFAMGGTNAHAVLEEAPARQASAPARSSEVLVLSARTASALELATERLRVHLEAHPEARFADVVHTLKVGRRAFPHRRAVVCRDREDAVLALGEPRRWNTARAHDDGPEVAFLLPGQGTQRVGMAQALYREEPVFRDEVDRCARLLEPSLGMDLRRALYPPEATPEAEAHLEQTAIAQPAIFTVEYALARSWQSRGIRPVAMLGHSLGEYVAACLAEVLSLDDALALVVARGRLMQGLPGGAMLAVTLDERALRPLLSPELSLAAVNGPAACVVSGPFGAIEALEARLMAREVGARRLRTSHAFHSAMMDPILAAFREEVRRVRLGPPRLPYLSGLTGTWVTEEQARNPDAWVQHLRQPVRFAAGLAELCTRARVLIETGPGRTLEALALARTPAPRVVPTLGGMGRSDLEAWQAALGQLWTEGAPVNWRADEAGRTGRVRVALPTYPFERQRHWLDHPAKRNTTPVGERPLDAVEEELRRALAIRPIASYPGLEQGLHALCASHLVAYLSGSRIDVSQGATHSREALRRELRLQPRFNRLFDSALAALADQGLLRLTGGEVAFLRDGHQLEPTGAIRQRLDAEHPGFTGLFDFVEQCLRGYGQALNGEVEAIGVLYPGGSSAFIQQCRSRMVEHTQERVYHQLLNEVARRFAARKGGRLRILEVGGGQGLLTWPLLESLREYEFEYHFTDLGKVFLDDARQEAARRGLDGRMRFELLDISQDAREQGFLEEGFDLVVAYNVVHATRDVLKTLGHLEQLLVPGGMLAMVEGVRLGRWDILSWGLAEGWWYFEDAFRTDSPLLPLTGWEAALARAGFEGVETYPRSEAARAAVDHGLILARRPATAAVTRPAPVAPRAPPPRPGMPMTYVAPRSELERNLARLCEELLGVSPVGIHDDFFTLGGDSLIMLRLTDRIRRELGLTVPASAAFRGLTVEKLARSMEKTPKSEPGTASSLVALQPTGSQPPLFLVHPAAGIVFPYIELARHLGPEQPVYGLQARGLDGGAPPDRSVEEMARGYLEAIRTLQPQGPYFLGGFSFGCLVAFEMAQQLSRMGQEVGLVALIDEPAPLPGHRPPPAMMATFLATGISRSIWPHLHDYLYLVNASKRQRKGQVPEPRSPASEGDGWWKRGMGRVETFLARSAMANFVPAESRILALRQPAMVPMFELFLIHLRATFTYEPRAYLHGVTLFFSEEVRRARGRNDPTMGWNKLAAGGVDLHPVPGDHLSLLKSPNVKTLAATLSDCLARARAARQ